MAQDHKFRILVPAWDIDKIVTRDEMQRYAKFFRGFKMVFKKPGE